MENPNKIKRSIRIPKDINEWLRDKSMESGKSANKVVLEILKGVMENEKSR